MKEGGISFSTVSLTSEKNNEEEKTNGEKKTDLLVSCPFCCSMLSGRLQRKGYRERGCRHHYGIYVEHGNVELLKKEVGIDADTIVKRILESLK